MKKGLLLGLYVMGLATIAGAQQTKKEKTRSCSCAFSAINQLGLLEGSKGSAFQLQTINGIRYKTWFAGIGAGLEYYHIRGIPVFLDIRKNILAKANTPFVYADGGIHYTWERDKDKSGYGKTEFNNGLYYDLGLGYKVRIKNDQAFLLSVGYSFKDVVETRMYEGYCPFFPPCVAARTEAYKYKLNRLSLKLGWQL
jgi:hypothetical protein